MAASKLTVEASERRCESENEHREKICVLKINLRELPVGYKKEEVINVLLPTVLQVKIAHKPDDLGQERRNLFRKLAARDADDPCGSLVDPQQSLGEPAAKVQRRSLAQASGDGVGVINSSPEPEKEDAAAAPAAAASGSASELGAPCAPSAVEAAPKGTVEVTVAGATHLLQQDLPPLAEMVGQMSVPILPDGVDHAPEPQRPAPSGPASSAVGDAGCVNGAADTATEEPAATQSAAFADVLKSFGVAASRPPIDVADSQQCQ